eukprot:scaffold18638_cov66-Phaeocystis_antarctica.AAC.2
MSVSVGSTCHPVNVAASHGPNPPTSSCVRVTMRAYLISRTEGKYNAWASASPRNARAGKAKASDRSSRSRPLNSMDTTMPPLSLCSVTEPTWSPLQILSSIIDPQSSCDRSDATSSSRALVLTSASRVHGAKAGNPSSTLRQCMSLLKPVVSSCMRLLLTNRGQSSCRRTIMHF